MFCKDCDNYKKRLFKKPLCLKPLHTSTDLVTGKKVSYLRTCEEQRQVTTLSSWPDTYCSEQGRNFVPKFINQPEWN
jgi:hypothetical protein